MTPTPSAWPPRLACLLCLVCLALAGAPEARAAEPTPTERLLVLFDELGAELGRAGEDCDAIARALADWTHTHGDELGALTVSVDAHLQALAPSEVSELERRLGAHFDLVIGSAVLCAEHDATLAALDAMDLALTGGGGAAAAESDATAPVDAP